MRIKIVLRLILVAVLFILSPSSLGQIQAPKDNGITNEVCIFIDADNPVSEKETMDRVQRIFQKAPVPIFVRFEGSVKLEIKDYLNPSWQEKNKTFAVCSHHGVKIVISGLSVGEAIKQGRLPRNGDVAVTKLYNDFCGFTIVYQNKLFDEAMLHEWGHQVSRDSYKNSSDRVHSTNKRSRMYKESGGGLFGFGKGHIWTAEDVQLIKARVRSIS